MTSSENTANEDLAARLARIDALEGELPRQAAPLITANSNLSYVDFFVIGAFRRVLAQARGFRSLIGDRNFPCAAAILRLQIDTAMRLNALRLIDDVNLACMTVLDGAHFNTLKDRDGHRLTDAYLRKRLAEQEPWINPVYEQTSDFVHLSGRHFYSAIARTEEVGRMAYFSISGQDPDRPEAVYYEIVDTFFRATRLVGLLLLRFLTVRAAFPHGETPGGSAAV